MIEAVLNPAICYGSEGKWKLAKDQANTVVQKTEAGFDVHEEAKRLLAAIADAESTGSN